MSIRAALHSPSLKMWVLPIILVVLIVGSAMSVVQQVFKYRQEFRALQQVRNEREGLDTDWGRLLIEQQTFGATPQIGTRAVMTLRMYSPPPSQTVVLSTPTL